MIPDFQTIMLPLLEIMSDNEEHILQNLVNQVCDNYNLTKEEREELVPSGVMSKIKDIILNFQMVKIKELSAHLRRRYTLIAPCKRSAARGRRIPTPVENSVGVQPATGLKGCGEPGYPELRFACTGLSMFIPYRGQERASINQNHSKKEYL